MPDANHSHEAAALIALERAALDRSDQGDAGGFLGLSDEDVTYFDPFLDRPIRGHEALREYYAKNFGAEPGTGVMADPHVQLLSEAAVLTFNYAWTNSRTGVVTRWNATEVYRRTEAGWRIVHTHWSFVQPLAARSVG